MTDTGKSADGKATVNPGLKLALELGPLVLFFLANARPGLFAPLLATVLSADLVTGERGGIFTATAVFMAATQVSLALTWALTGRLAVMPLVSGVVVLVFGGLTLVLHDDLFIKLKPTIVNLLFAGVLLGGLAFGKPLLALVLDQVFDLTDEGWRILTRRWGLFFIVLAALNEIVWRSFPTDVWVTFKVFGVMPLTIAFAMAQVPLLTRYEAKKG